MARVPSLRRMPSHKPIFLCTPAGRLLLSLRRAFTFPSLSPGDAVLVLWRASEAQLPQTIGLVLQCCQQIQKKHGIRDTHVGLKLQLKIGMGAAGSAVPRAQPWRSPVLLAASCLQSKAGSSAGASANGKPPLPAFHTESLHRHFCPACRLGKARVASGTLPHVPAAKQPRVGVAEKDCRK